MGKNKCIIISKEMQERMDKHNKGLVIFDEFSSYLEMLSETEIKARMEMKEWYLNGRLNISDKEYIERFKDSQEIDNFITNNLLVMVNAVNKIRDIVADTIVFEEKYKSEIGYQKRKYLTNKM